MAKAVMPASKVPWDELIEDYDVIRDLIRKPSPAPTITTRAFLDGGFRIPLPPTERQWPERRRSTRRCFPYSAGLHEDETTADKDTLRLITLRSRSDTTPPSILWTIATAGVRPATYCS